MVVDKVCRMSQGVGESVHLAGDSVVFWLFVLGVENLCLHSHQKDCHIGLCVQLSALIMMREKATQTTLSKRRHGSIQIHDDDISIDTHRWT